MKQLIKILKSELYKLVHSSLIYIHLVVPVLGIAVFLTYYTFSPWDETEKITAYLQAVAIVFPLLIAIITTITAEQEAKAGFFQPLQIVPCHKSIIHLIKCFLLLVMGFFSTMLAVIGFEKLFCLTENTPFLTSFYIKAAILLFVGNIPLYLLQYIVGFAFHKGVGIGMGIVGSLLSALMQTGLGDTIWYYLPWGISSRLCGTFVVCRSFDIPFWDCINVEKGVLFMVLAIMLLLIFLILWSKNWEIPLTKSEYQICEYLVRNKGQVFSLESILEATLGYDSESDVSAIRMHIKNIRRKFSKYAECPIETVWGVGYKWR